MRKASTVTSCGKRLKISQARKKAYAKRDHGLNQDSDGPQMPPDFLEQRGDREILPSTQDPGSFRIDNDVLDWLKSEGRGHLSRIK